VISGSGLLIPTSEPVAVGEEVLVELCLPGGHAESVRALARVVGMRGAPGGGEAKAVALAFSLIDELDRAAIVRFTHEVQRALSNGSGSKRDEK
jgi:c-di-GMP-binding flagellar brake protein YcgR